MHLFIQKYIESNNFGRLLDMNFTIPEPGKVDYRLKVSEKHLATPHVAHGGMLAAMMDAIIGVAALSVVCEEGNIVSTVEFKINYLNPAMLNDELIGTAEIEHRGKRILVVSGTIKSITSGKIIARGIGTFNAYPVAKAGYADSMMV